MASARFCEIPACLSDEDDALKTSAGVSKLSSNFWKYFEPTPEWDSKASVVVHGNEYFQMSDFDGMCLICF